MATASPPPSASAIVPFTFASTATFSTPTFILNTPISLVSAGLAGAVIALVSAIYFVRAVNSKDEGNDDMKRIRRYIYNGARAYLLTQYRWLSLWCFVMFFLLALVIGLPQQNSGAIRDGFLTAACFIIGSVASALAGYIGMLIATQANSRTAQACVTSMTQGLEVSFASGAVMGNAVVGLGLLGLSSLYLIFTYASDNSLLTDGVIVNNGAGTITYTWSAFSGVFNRLAGFGFGASTIGMFARVGGGVFTKAADVGSDLVGKVESGIPEDDPRNPAVIADNVGDNVGDVAGMGADLFESYAGAVIATATLAPRFAADTVDRTLNSTEQPKQFNSIMAGAVALPFWINGFGIIASLIGIWFVRSRKLDDRSTNLEQLLGVITNGVVVATVITMAASAFCVWTLFAAATAGKLFGALAIGLVAGVIISKFTEYCTAYEFAPTQGISAAAEYGPAPVIIKGLGVGMMSVSVPAFTIGITIVACNALAGQYGVAISAVGLLSTLGITLATDAYGPVADNAGGIAEMAGLPPQVRSRTDKLDSLGNTTAATGKGLAIASATLTAVGLIAAFVEQSGLTRITSETVMASVDPNRVIDLSDSIVLTGVLLGACLPYIFAALTMLSVDRGARAIITEVRLQFATAPELLEEGPTRVNEITKNGQTYPNSTRCVQIATEAAIQEMVLPGVLAVFVPIVIGFVLGPKGTVGLLAGGLGGCFMLALTMATTGGAWDNAKKWNEKCASEGEPVGKDAAGREILTFTHFGVKLKGDDSNFDKFREMVAEFGRESMLHKETASEFVGPEGDMKLFKHLAERYHNLHSATVTGDTVGDPFKDTSGPALNVLIKTMTMMALVLAPAYEAFGEYNGFGKIGCSLAAGLALVVGVASFILVRYFRKINAVKNDVAVAAMKEARKANALRTAGAGAGYTVHDTAAGASEEGLQIGLLSGGRA